MTFIASKTKLLKLKEICIRFYKDFRCGVGIHNTKRVNLGKELELKNKVDGKPIDLRYKICSVCNDGDPRLTGEW